MPVKDNKSPLSPAQIELTVRVLNLKSDLMKIGLYATAHYVDDVQTMIGWELAGDIEKGRISIERRRGT